MTKPSIASTKSASNSTGITTVGIDVGGERKGFHAVALTDGRDPRCFSTTCVRELVRWCRKEVQARVIAVDAPCSWSKKDEHSRLAERELMKNGIACFSTPIRATAIERKHQYSLGKASNYYGWMLRGEELFEALAEEFPLCRKLPAAGRKCCFETFPHAITWHLRGGTADASQKRIQRRALLEEAGVDIADLTNIDLVDAALCALTAHYAATGKECASFGEPDTGLIIVPKKQKS